MFNTNTRTSSWMRLKPSGRRVAIVDEHIPDTKCAPPEVHSAKNVENRTTGRKSADLDSNHKGCQHHIHQQPRNVHSVIESPSPPCDDPKELYFSPVTVSTVTRDEALTHISVQLPTHPLNTACMRVKVDTGAQGNVLPLSVTPWLWRHCTVHTCFV